MVHMDMQQDMLEEMNALLLRERQELLQEQLNNHQKKIHRKIQINQQLMNHQVISQQGIIQQ